MPTPMLHPSLVEALNHAGLDSADFDIGIHVEGGPGEAFTPREELMLIGEEEQAVWTVPSLASLVRGNVVPPDLREYPPQYVAVFAAIEQRVLMMSNVGRPPTDGEMEAIYANLRRRPDGRSGGWAHDSVWRIVAFTLGRFPLSAAELEAVLTRLARSAKFWKTGASSRNYLDHLKKMFPDRPGG